MSRFIVDASAVLAFLNDETGAEAVRAVIPDARINAVNMAEVLARSIELGHTNDSAYESFAALGMEVIAFDERHARKAAELRAVTTHLGLSLCDRSCLASAILYNATAVTADRSWAGVECCKVETIR